MEIIALYCWPSIIPWQQDPDFFSLARSNSAIVTSTLYRVNRPNNTPPPQPSFSCTTWSQNSCKILNYMSGLPQTSLSLDVHACTPIYKLFTSPKNSTELMDCPQAVGSNLSQLLRRTASRDGQPGSILGAAELATPRHEHRPTWQHCRIQDPLNP